MDPVSRTTGVQQMLVGRRPFDQPTANGDGPALPLRRPAGPGWPIPARSRARTGGRGDGDRNIGGSGASGNRSGGHGTVGDRNVWLGRVGRRTHEL